MKGLLLIAHGSRRQSSNEEIAALAAHLRAAAERFDRVEHAFLEMAAPSIQGGFETLIKAGVAEIIVLPYFLAAGQHVAVDIPAQIALLEARHPTVRITVAPHLGGADGMRAFIHDHLRQME